ncbi:glycosyltransferase [Ammoniphilus sp. YIM 78166]|uniref:glycosyltransferase n=1 Tax=Ammoniphilus sp. YIM 78166 TaxID=1644106 RepID=UPI001070489E|nr:glycosyltransferase [Ammoniphilus sp. YIM 78166]
MEVMNRKPLCFPKFIQPKISIILTKGSTFKRMYYCIKSIIQKTCDISYEVVLINEGPLSEKLRKYFPNIKIVEIPTKQGFLTLLNYVAGSALGDYVVFLASDSKVKENWLGHLFETMERDKQIGVIGPKLLDPNGKIWASGGVVWKNGKKTLYGKGDDKRNYQYNYLKEVDYLPSVCIMMRASILKHLRGGDSRFTSPAYEDMDLAFRCRQLGYKVVYEPTSEVIFYPSDKDSISRRGKRVIRKRNRTEFVNKWRHILYSENFKKGKDVFWARDRSRNKKTVVVIDENGPKFDKQTVARSTFHYLNLFISMGMNVIFIGDNHWVNQVNYCRQEPYTTTLEKLGIQVLYGEWNESNLISWIKKHSRYIDYVYLCRPHIAKKYLNQFKKYTSAKIIYNNCDLHYLREFRNYQVTKNPFLLKQADKWKGIEFEIIEKSDVIHVVSSFEQELLERYFPKKPIRHIPVFIYDKQHTSRECSTFDNRSHIMFIGQFAHKPNADAVEWFCQSILPLVTKHAPGIKIYIIGANLTSNIKKLASENVIIEGQVSDSKLEEFYKKCKLVVAPLRFGAGVKGKVIEAMYNGVPVITTSIGAEGLPEIEEFLPIANCEENFASYILDVYYSRDKWEYITNKSYEYIQRFFSKDYARQQIEKDIRISQ